MFNNTSHVVLDDRCWKGFFKYNARHVPSAILPYSDKPLSKDVLSGKIYKLQKHIARLETQVLSCQGGSRQRSRRVSLSQQVSVAKERFALLQKAYDLVIAETRKYAAIRDKPPMPFVGVGMGDNSVASMNLIQHDPWATLEEKVYCQKMRPRITDARRNPYGFGAVDITRKREAVARQVIGISVPVFNRIGNAFRMFGI
jgi:hypothetical protein